MSKCVLCDRFDSVAVVTINRADALNALNPEVLSALYDCMNELENELDVRVIIITGAGQKAFVAGADIASMANLSPTQAKKFADVGHRTMDKIAAMPQVVIAAINGFALGGGCELALACDIRVASKNVQMGIPEATLGVIPGFGGTQRLPRLIGLGKAIELLSTGDRWKADKCLDSGLVNYVVDADDLMNFCLTMAKKITTNSCSAIEIGKMAMKKGVELELQSALAYEKYAFGLVFSTKDQKEGMQAFLEKRKAKFD